MKEFKKALLCVTLLQMMCWVIFIIIDENKLMPQSSAESLAFNIGIIFIISLLVLYFVYGKKYIKKNKLNSKRFNICLLSIWTVFTIIITSFLLVLVYHNYLHICERTGALFDCFLNGFEYFVEGAFMIILVILIIIIKVIILIYNHFKKQ